MDDMMHWGEQLGARGAAAWLDVFRRIGFRVGSPSLRRRLMEYVHGLLSPVERKNGWQLAEAAAHSTPCNLQHLLDRAPWEADTVRDGVTDYVAATLGEADGVLVVDETGFLKKGTHSVGVKRQYSGTAGRIENCQIGVFLAYASGRGRALIDRELYLPQDWAEDAARRRATKVPQEVAFATKPELARQMIERAIAARVPFAWVTGDEAYGDSRLHLWLEQEGVHYVLAVASNWYVWAGVQQARVAQVAQATPLVWQTLSAGDGAKGPRYYAWARLPLLSRRAPDEHWLLLRRSLKDGQLAYYECHAPQRTSLAALVRVAGSRWTIEECFEAAKGEVGLDQYEVRSWHGWYRHVTLAMLAHAYLAAFCAQERDQAIQKKVGSSALQAWKQRRASPSASRKYADCCGEWPSTSPPM